MIVTLLEALSAPAVTVSVCVPAVSSATPAILRDALVAAVKPEATQTVAFASLLVKRALPV